MVLGNRIFDVRMTEMVSTSIQIGGRGRIILLLYLEEGRSQPAETFVAFVLGLGEFNFDFA